MAGRFQSGFGYRSDKKFHEWSGAIRTEARPAKQMLGHPSLRANEAGVKSRPGSAEIPPGAHRAGDGLDDADHALATRVRILVPQPFEKSLVHRHFSNFTGPKQRRFYVACVANRYQVFSIGYGE
jgi:hypothetical protein